MSTQRSSASELGKGLITALAQRDFPRLANTLTPNVRMRALIPPGPVEQFPTLLGMAQQEGIAI